MFFCDLCNDGFSHLSDLEFHKIHNHYIEMEEAKKYEADIKNYMVRCMKCHYEFPGDSDYENHLCKPHPLLGSALDMAQAKLQVKAKLEAREKIPDVMLEIATNFVSKELEQLKKNGHGIKKSEKENFEIIWINLYRHLLNPNVQTSLGFHNQEEAEKMSKIQEDDYGSYFGTVKVEIPLLSTMEISTQIMKSTYLSQFFFGEERKEINLSNKRPHICPICAGKTEFKITSQEELIALGNSFNLRRDNAGNSYKMCLSCEGKGVLWG
jgi:hypothetical protein